MQEGLEDGELGLERRGMRGAQVSAMCSVGLGGLGAICKGPEADTATTGHVEDERCIWYGLMLDHLHKPSISADVNHVISPYLSLR